jgi:1-acyl-sn-glycerol-3-phosphate acyltransferase
VKGAALAHSSADEVPALYRLIRAALAPVVDVLFRLRVEGVERVPASGPAILCPNHLSALDPVVVAVAVRRPIYHLAKSEFFRHWRWPLSRLGVLPVVRGGGAAAESSLERGRQVLAAGRLLGIYPEGTRSPDGRLYRGRTGAARLAIRTGAPVVPIGVVGSREVWPPGRLLPRSGPVVVRVGPPLDFSHLRGRDDDRTVLRDATDALMTAIADLSRQGYADVYAAQARAAQAAEGSSQNLRGPGPTTHAADRRRRTRIPVARSRTTTAKVSATRPHSRSTNHGPPES